MPPMVCVTPTPCPSGQHMICDPSRSCSDTFACVCEGKPPFTATSTRTPRICPASPPPTCPPGEGLACEDQQCVANCLCGTVTPTLTPTPPPPGLCGSQCGPDDYTSCTGICPGQYFTDTECVAYAGFPSPCVCFPECPTPRPTPTGTVRACNCNCPTLPEPQCGRTVSLGSRWMSAAAAPRRVVYTGGGSRKQPSRQRAPRRLSAVIVTCRSLVKSDRGTAAPQCDRMAPATGA